MSGPTGGAAHRADRMPTDEEEQAAERSAAELEESGGDAEVAAHYEDMARRGVEHKGEGRIDPR